MEAALSPSSRIPRSYWESEVHKGLRVQEEARLGTVGAGSEVAYAPAPYRRPRKFVVSWNDAHTAHFIQKTELIDVLQVTRLLWESIMIRPPFVLQGSCNS